MFKSKTITLNGLELRGDTPITPRTKTFLTSKGANVQQSDGFIVVNGSFSISAIEVAEFQKKKAEEDCKAKNTTSLTCKP